jgi:hypothetical protein
MASPDYPGPVHARRRTQERFGGLPGDGRPPLELLPLEGQGRPVRPGGAARQGAPAAGDANQIGPHLEQRIIAFSRGHLGYGPRRISAEPARKKLGGIRISEHGVWRVLKRVWR